MTTKNCLPGVLYVRVSTDMQDRSPAQQRAEMLAKCKLEGVTIDAEFEDIAVSGGKLAGRDGFMEMLAYCEQRHRQGRPIGTVVCYDSSRFSRADSIRTASSIATLMDTGVRYLLTAERWCDFTQEGDRALFLLQQDFSNHRFLVEHSRRVLRGQKETAQAGYSCGGPVRYGFDRLLIDERGQEVQRIRRGEKIQFKQQGWRVEPAPIPADDPDPDRALERATVEWLFETFDREEVGFRALARTLNERGIPGPGRHVLKGKPARWSGEAVRDMLENPTYCGFYRWGREGVGSYHRLVNGQIVPVEHGSQASKNTAGVILAKLRHGEMVSQELWERVQQKIQDQGRKGRLQRSGHYVLGGLVYCGACGGKMHGETRRRRRNGHEYLYRFYTCIRYKHTPGACRPYGVSQHKLLRALARKLQEDYLDEGRLGGLRQALRDEIASKHQAGPEKARKLRRRLAALDAEITQGRKNLLKIKDDETFVEVNDELQKLIDQRNRLRREQEAVDRSRTVPEKELASKVDAAVDRLKTLRERLQDADPKKLAEVLRLLVFRIDLYFDQVPKRVHCWYRFNRGLIKTRPILEFTATVGSGCRSTG